MWHEIVGDVAAGQFVAVAFCQLCNGGKVFDARIDRVPHAFGVSGKLRHSDMVVRPADRVLVAAGDRPRRRRHLYLRAGA